MVRLTSVCSFIFTSCAVQHLGLFLLIIREHCSLTYPCLWGHGAFTCSYIGGPIIISVSLWELRFCFCFWDWSYLWLYYFIPCCFSVGTYFLALSCGCMCLSGLFIVVCSDIQCLPSFDKGSKYTEDVQHLVGKMEIFLLFSWTVLNCWSTLFWNSHIPGIILFFHAIVWGYSCYLAIHWWQHTEGLYGVVLPLSLTNCYSFCYIFSYSVYYDRIR